MKQSILFFFIFLFPVLLFGQPAFETKVRIKKKFNNDWKFTREDKAGFEITTVDDRNWRTLNLPHDWGIEGPFDVNHPAGGNGAYLPAGIGWYRKSFSLPDSLKGKRIVVQFDGVYMNARVYINGHFLGQYPYGFSTFQYDLTEHLHFDKPNVIAVRVDNTLQPSSRWYSGSGIYRNVWLITTNQIHFDQSAGAFVTYPKVSETDAEIKVQYNVTANAFPESDFRWWRRNIDVNKRVSKAAIIRTAILDSKGATVTEGVVKETIGDFSNVTFTHTLPVKNPKLWSARSPDTYTLKSTLEVDGRILDDYVTRIGIRKIDFTPQKGMLVNGAPEKLKGVCLHQEAGSLGVAVPAGVWHERLKKLKEMGCNAIRPSHHPFAPEFYDLCDTMGFYVMDEAFDEWNKGYPWGATENTYGKTPYGYHLYFNQWAETDLRAMIRRDRNHPSVVMYSIGNEIPNQRTPDGVQLAKKLQDICHSEDPTRPVTSAADFVLDANRTGFLSVLDIAGYNYIDRYNGPEMYAPEKANYPNRVILGTETYHDTRYWLAVRDNEYVAGEFVWVGYDYLGEDGVWPKHGWDAGIIDMAGTPYAEYYLRKSYWSGEPVVQIAVETSAKRESDWHPRKAVSHWNHQWSGNYLLPLYVYSNCDEVELLINDSIVGRKAIDKNLYYARWEIPFQAGKVQAIGYKNKNRVTQHTLRTAESAAAFRVNPTKTTLVADNEDVVLFEVALVDKNGVVDPGAANEVTVKVSGPATLVGLDNGNLSDVTPLTSNKRKAFAGRLLVTVQATGREGDVTVELWSPNLKQEAFTIKAVLPSKLRVK
jgi:beta-galactosidase